jgi:hypothetical protein
MAKKDIFICVSGGTRREKELITEVAYLAQKKLMPRIRKLELVINVKKLDVYADVLNLEERLFEMRICRGMNLYDIITTVCHEMVHIKQYVRGELNACGTRWKSRKISDKTQYMDLPWEKEAFKLEEKLALEVFKEIKFIPK